MSPSTTARARALRLVSAALRAKRRGTAAVELAVGAPFLFLLLAAGADVVNYHLAQQRVESASAQLAQIVTQCSAITTTGDTNEFINFAQTAVGNRVNLTNAAGGALIISALGVVNNAARVRWQVRSGNTTWVSSFGTTATNPATLSGNMTLLASETYFGVEIYGQTQAYVISNNLMASFLGTLRGVTVMVSRASDPVSLQTTPTTSSSRNCTA